MACLDIFKLGYLTYNNREISDEVGKRYGALSDEQKNHFCALLDEYHHMAKYVGKYRRITKNALLLSAKIKLDIGIDVFPLIENCTNWYSVKFRDAGAWSWLMRCLTSFTDIGSCDKVRTCLGKKVVLVMSGDEIFAEKGERDDI